MWRMLVVLAISAGLMRGAPERGAKASVEVTMTGCVDSREGKYVLTGDVRLREKYTLRAVSGTDDDNFARFVGTKVRVTGKRGGGDEFRVTKVRKIENGCAPSEPSK